MTLRKKIKKFFSPFNSHRLLLIVLTLLVVVLIGLMVSFFFFGKNKYKNNFDSKTLCLFEGASNGVMVFIDQTTGITAKQAAGIGRRIKKIAIDQVDQFGRLTIYTLTRDNRTEKVGFICNPGNINKIEEDWVALLGMRKKQIFDYYRSGVNDLANRAMEQMIAKPDAAESKIMEGIRDAITLYKNPTPTDPTKESAKAPDDNIDLDWLIIFSDMKEQRPDFSLRTATAKTTPAILDFWAKNESLKLDLSQTTVGIYYFKDKKDKNKKTTTQEKRNSKFRTFWEDYWQSQGATVEWFRGIE